MCTTKPRHRWPLYTSAPDTPTHASHLSCETRCYVFALFVCLCHCDGRRGVLLRSKPRRFCRRRRHRFRADIDCKWHRLIPGLRGAPPPPPGGGAPPPPPEGGAPLWMRASTPLGLRARGAPPASLRVSGLSAQGGAGAQRSLLDLFELEHRAPVWHGEKFCQQIHGRHGRAVFVRRYQGAV